MDESDTDIYLNIDKDGTKIYKNAKGELHRLDCPAIEWLNGDKYWYKEGDLHREDGPAREYANANKFWCKEGLSHRVDGPAIEWTNGDKYWYLLFKELEEKEFNSWTLRIQKFI